MTLEQNFNRKTFNYPNKIRREVLEGEMNRRIFVTLLTTILLVISAFPASANGAQQIPISGTCTIYAMGGEYGWGGLPADPDYRYWDIPVGSNWRYQTWGIYCEFNDDRLPAYIVTVDNWNNVKALGLSHAYGYSTNENWESDGLWDGYSVGTMVWETGVMNIKGEMNGHGIYQGWLLKTFWTSTEAWGVYDVVGELLIPGK